MSEMQRNKIGYILATAVLINFINGIMIYCLSLEVASNLYYSQTQYATLFSTCLMFLGHGVGGVVYALFHKIRREHIRLFIQIWIGTVVFTLLILFFWYPDLIQAIHFLHYPKSIIGFFKILAVGVIEFPVFMVEGIIYSSLFCVATIEHPAYIAPLAAASTLGSALGYVGGLFIPDFPGINASFIVCVAMLILWVFSDKSHIIHFCLLGALGVTLFYVDVDAWIEQMRPYNNSVYAKNIGGTVVAYDWSRFQKSEYIISNINGNDRIALTLNGALQVVASQNPRLVKNLGYDAIYQESIVKGKNVLIVGGGMGRGAQVAHKNGAAHIDVVDIEPSLLNKKYVYDEYSDYIWDKENVNFYVADGRAILHQLDSAYDLIVFEGVINAAAVYSLNITSEGYLCTSEAIDDALRLLKDDGVFVDYTISSERTVKSYIASHYDMPKDMEAIYMYSLVDDSPASLKYYVSLSCLSKNKTGLDSIETVLRNSQSDEGIAVSNYESRSITEGSDFTITDDRPFPHIPSRSSVMFMMAWFGVFVILGAITWGVGIRRKSIESRFSVFFVLGMGMMMIELYFINKMNFFLDDSVMSYALTSIIFLIAFSLGNAQSIRFESICRWKFMTAFALCFMIPILFLNFSDRFALLKYSLILRILLVTVILAPISFLCGTFFPRLLQRYLTSEGTSKSMGYIMLLDSFGVGAGFFLFNYIGIAFGFNYAVPLIVGCYYIVAVSSMKTR